jgi:hypothetical protein
MLCLWVIALVAAKGVAAYAMHPAEDNRQAAREIAALTPLQDFVAVIVVENTDAMYAIEEQTPWGLRLYLNKPVYGVAWRTPEGAASLCSAIRDQHQTLVIIDHAIDPAAIQPALASCQVHAADQLGTWRGNALLRIKS